MQRLNYLAFSALTILGCASAQGNTEAATPASEENSEMRGGRGDMASECPMHVEGTTVSAEDVEGGVALEFTTGSDVTELRSRVENMAQRHGQQGMGRPGMYRVASARDGQGHGMHGNEPSQHPEGTMAGGRMMPAATARSEEVEGGARLLLTPKDAADLQQLREHARDMSERMSSGQCPMRPMQADAAASPPKEGDAE